MLQREQDYGHSPTPSNLPQPNTRSAARSSKADSAVVRRTAPIGDVSRERVSYSFSFALTRRRVWSHGAWVISTGDLSTSPFLDREPSQRRVTTLCLPSLIGRCRTTLTGYAANEKIRGTSHSQVCYLICGIICISFVIVTLFTAQSR